MIVLLWTTLVVTVNALSWEDVRKQGVVDELSDIQNEIEELERKRGLQDNLVASKPLGSSESLPEGDRVKKSNIQNEDFENLMARAGLASARTRKRNKAMLPVALKTHQNEEQESIDEFLKRVEASDGDNGLVPDRSKQSDQAQQEPTKSIEKQLLQAVLDEMAKERSSNASITDQRDETTTESAEWPADIFAAFEDLDPPPDSKKDNMLVDATALNKILAPPEHELIRGSHCGLCQRGKTCLIVEGKLSKCIPYTGVVTTLECAQQICPRGWSCKFVAYVHEEDRLHAYNCFQDLKRARVAELLLHNMVMRHNNSDSRPKPSESTTNITTNVTASLMSNHEEKNNKALDSSQFVPGLGLNHLKAADFALVTESSTTQNDETTNETPANETSDAEEFDLKSLLMGRINKLLEDDDATTLVNHVEEKDGQKDEIVDKGENEEQEKQVNGSDTLDGNVHIKDMKDEEAPPGDVEKFFVSLLLKAKVLSDDFSLFIGKIENLPVLNESKGEVPVCSVCGSLRHPKKNQVTIQNCVEMGPGKGACLPPFKFAADGCAKKVCGDALLCKRGLDGFMSNGHTNMRMVNRYHCVFPEEALDCDTNCKNPDNICLEHFNGSRKCVPNTGNVCPIGSVLKTGDSNSPNSSHGFCDFTENADASVKADDEPIGDLDYHEVLERNEETLKRLQDDIKGLVAGFDGLAKDFPALIADTLIKVPETLQNLTKPMNHSQVAAAINGMVSNLTKNMPTVIKELVENASAGISNISKNAPTEMKNKNSGGPSDDLTKFLKSPLNDRVEQEETALFDQVEERRSVSSERVKEGSGSPTDRKEGSDTSSERVEEGSGTSSERVEDGSGTSSERVEEGSGTSSERVKDGSGTSSERVEEGSGTSPERVEEGSDTSSERVEEGSGASSERVEEGSGTSSERVEEGSGTSSERVKEGSATSSERVQEGSATSSERVEEGSGASSERVEEGSGTSSERVEEGSGASSERVEEGSGTSSERVKEEDDGSSGRVKVVSAVPSERVQNKGSRRVMSDRVEAENAATTEAAKEETSTEESISAERIVEEDATDVDEKETENTSQDQNEENLLEETKKSKSPGKDSAPQERAVKGDRVREDPQEKREKIEKKEEGKRPEKQEKDGDQEEDPEERTEKPKSNRVMQVKNRKKDDAPTDPPFRTHKRFTSLELKAKKSELNKAIKSD